jgi:hypothetical protein
VRVSEAGMEEELGDCVTLAPGFSSTKCTVRNQYRDLHDMLGFTDRS